jgi:hypothetical protein
MIGIGTEHDGRRSWRRKVLSAAAAKVMRLRSLS